MIKSLKLTHFKTWDSLDLNLGSITVLFGKNSAGKTSIIQSLLMLKQTAASFDRNQAIHFGGLERDYVDLGSYRDVVFQHDESYDIGLKMVWDAPEIQLSSEHVYSNHPLSYEVVWGKQTDIDTVVTKSLKYEVIGGQPPMFFSMTREGDDYRADAPLGLKVQRGQRRLLRAPENSFAIPSEVNDEYKADFTEFNRQFRALMDRIHYLGPLRHHPQRNYPWPGSTPTDIGKQGENTIPMLIGSARQAKPAGKGKKSVKRLIDHVSESLVEVGLLDSFSVDAIDRDKRFYAANVKVSGQTTDSSLIDIGFGVSQVLPIITALFSVPENSILMIEQPELHLHPLAQAKLADLMLRVAHKRGIQFIIESHSEHILRRFQRRVAEGNNPIATVENLTLYFCNRRAGVSVLEPVGLTPYGQINNWPDDFFGDTAGDLEAMMEAGLERRLTEVGNG